MKKLFNILFILSFVAVATSCIENDPVHFTGAVAEFDAAVWNTPASGQTYPILTRVPGFGRAVSTNSTAPSTADPLITRASGTINFRVNLVGAPQPTQQSIPVSVVSENSTAVAGTHYTAPTEVVIPAGENFGILSVPVLNPGATTGSVVVVLQIDGNSSIAPSENYKRIGISIAQN